MHNDYNLFILAEFTMKMLKHNIKCQNFKCGMISQNFLKRQ